MKTKLNGLPHFTSSSLCSLFPFLSIQLVTIRILKVGPKPCWILPGNGWLALSQEPFQSGIILMNFSQSKVWPEDLQVQKFNLVSVPGFAWYERAGLCELNSQNTKTSHQNVKTSVDKGMCSCQKDQMFTLFSPALFLPGENLPRKSITTRKFLSEQGIRARAV